MKRVAVKQLSRGICLIGNGRKMVPRKDSTHFLPRLDLLRGGHPTTLLLDVRMINIGPSINWSNMMHWRHVVLTGLRGSRMLRCRRYRTCNAAQRCRSSRNGLMDAENSPVLLADT